MVDGMVTFSWYPGVGFRGISHWYISWTLQGIHNPNMKFAHCSKLPCRVRCRWWVYNCSFLIAGVGFLLRVLQHALQSASGFQARSFAPPVRSGPRAGEVSPARAMCFQAGGGAVGYCCFRRAHKGCPAGPLSGRVNSPLIGWWVTFLIRRQVRCMGAAHPSADPEFLWTSGGPLPRLRLRLVPALHRHGRFVASSTRVPPSPLAADRKDFAWITPVLCCIRAGPSWFRRGMLSFGPPCLIRLSIRLALLDFQSIQEFSSSGA